MTAPATFAAAPGIVAAVPASAQAAAAAAATARPHMTGDTPIGTLPADPAARAIADRHVPRFSATPRIGMASGATPIRSRPTKPDLSGDTVLAAIDAEPAGLPAR